jgi:hypothetical protein
MNEQPDGGRSVAPPPHDVAGQSAAQQLADARSGFRLADFLTFRYMITPPLITVIYIIGAVLVTIGSIAYINTSALGAVFAWIFLMLYLRVILELIVVLFRINDGIQTIARRDRER